jgi:hypothetical protein
MSTNGILQPWLQTDDDFIMTLNSLVLIKGHTLDLGALAEYNDFDYIDRFSFRQQSTKSLELIDTSSPIKSKRHRIKLFFQKFRRKQKSQMKHHQHLDLEANDRTEFIMCSLRTAQLLRTNTYLSSMYPMTPTFVIKQDTEEELRKTRISSLRLHTNDVIESSSSSPSSRPSRPALPMISGLTSRVRRRSTVVTTTAISSLMGVSDGVLNNNQDLTIHHSILESLPDIASGTYSTDSQESYYSFDKSQISRVSTRIRPTTAIRPSMSNSLPSPINIDFWIEQE